MRISLGRASASQVMLVFMGDVPRTLRIPIRDYKALEAELCLQQAVESLAVRTTIRVVHALIATAWLSISARSILVCYT